MRVLLLNQVYYPDAAATAQHADDLGRHLVAHGHEVHVIASRALYGSKGASLPRLETVGGVHVHRVGRSIFGKGSIPARMADFALFYLLALCKAFVLPKPDVVVCFTTPPFIALVGWFLRVVKGTKFVYWVMDLYPDAPVACGIMKPNSLTTKFFEHINRFCLRTADRTVVLGRCMYARVVQKGIDASGVTHIGVWPGQQDSDGQEASSGIDPDRSTNPYRAEWNLGERFVVMYSGNFGLGHDVGTMLEAARVLDSDPAWSDRVRFVFAGGGKKKATVEQFVAEHKLMNCVLTGYQPRERLMDSLSCADLHLASLLNGFEGVMVPCKLFGIMAAQRPCAYIGNASGELSRILVEHDAGTTISQGDAQALVEYIKRLANDPAEVRRIGQNAYHALQESFSRAKACEQWRVLLEEVVAKY
jgi:colanic acid biosynthesis glycosyl transferase WcaI